MALVFLKKTNKWYTDKLWVYFPPFLLKTWWNLSVWECLTPNHQVFRLSLAFCEGRGKKNSLAFERTHCSTSQKLFSLAIRSPWHHYATAYTTSLFIDKRKQLATECELLSNLWCVCGRTDVGLRRKEKSDPSANKWKITELSQRHVSCAWDHRWGEEVNGENEE